MKKKSVPNSQFELSITLTDSNNFHYNKTKTLVSAREVMAERVLKRKSYDSKAKLKEKW